MLFKASLLDLKGNCFIWYHFVLFYYTFSHYKCCENLGEDIAVRSDHELSFHFISYLLTFIVSWLTLIGFSPFQSHSIFVHSCCTHVHSGFAWVHWYSFVFTSIRSCSIVFYLCSLVFHPCSPVFCLCSLVFTNVLFVFHASSKHGKLYIVGMYI